MVRDDRGPAPGHVATHRERAQYASHDETITVPEGDSYQVMVTLDPLFGDVSSSSPTSKATRWMPPPARMMGRSMMHGVAARCSSSTQGNSR